ncbi:MAG TPA: hypothetical protein VFC21_10010 [Bryobacteraceae bacterium]|nr:hypothetical protein [Bryobacteraceae bacterium]
MRGKLLLLLLVARAASGGIAGEWEGGLEFPAAKLHFILHLSGSDDALSGTAESPDQGMQPVRVESPTFKDDCLRFRIAALGVIFAGDVDDDDEALIRGVFSQKGLNVPLILTRVMTSAPTNVARFMAGNWSGVLDTPRGMLHLVLHFTESAVAADSPDEGIAGMPVELASEEAGKVSFRIPKVFASFEGTVAAGEIRGIFQQAGYGFPLVLKPSGAIKP